MTSLCLSILNPALYFEDSLLILIIFSLVFNLQSSHMKRKRKNYICMELVKVSCLLIKINSLFPGLWFAIYVPDWKWVLNCNTWCQHVASLLTRLLVHWQTWLLMEIATIIMLLLGKRQVQLKHWSDSLILNMKV